MGVYIKGMEMPFCCLVCPCSGTDNTDDGNEVWVCEASKLRQITTEDKIERRPEWCPLVPIPPHGRCVDADALIDAGWQLGRDNIFTGKYEIALLSSVPTIIEAEDD